MTSHGRAGSASWTASRKRIWLPSRAAVHPKDTSTGHSSCWPARWWSWSLPRASPWRRCARYSKKRTQTVEKKEWCIPRLSGEFVARMEDVLDLYAEPYDPDRPVVCFDETSRQLLGEVRPPIAAAPGRVARYDTEYQRNGTRNLFMFCEPKGGWRHVEVTERRTAVDFAHQMRWLVDQAYPDAEVIRLALDNLNTHKLGSLYEAFEPSEARRIAKRLELHHTPNHGSWLNMAEIELSVFSRQCLNRRVGDEALLRREVAALERERNEAAAIIDWRFSTQDARSKLKHIYPIELN